MADTLIKKLTWKDYVKEVIQSNVLMITFFIGMFHMTNYWDYPIYFVVAGAIILFSNATKYQFSFTTIKVTALQGIFVILGSYIVALPFTLNFKQISTEICIADQHTPIYQLLILWGLPICILVGFIIACIHHYKNQNHKINMNGKGKAWNHFKDFMLKIDFTDLFIILLGLCAVGLVLMPEIIYVKDIYNGDYKRANTMFKLTYQSFIMFSICSGYILVKLAALKETKAQRKYAMIGIILSVCTICYIGHSVNAWFGDVRQYKNRGNLDAAAFLERSLPDDKDAIQWLNDNVKGHPVILEANGKSYTDYQRVSVFTGLPTVAGWYVHEWLWRGDTPALDQRNNDIRTIYTTTDFATMKQLVDQYNIDYIYVGNLERELFETVSDELLPQLGGVVFVKDSSQEGGQSTYIVKVER